MTEGVAEQRDANVDKNDKRIPGTTLHQPRQITSFSDICGPEALAELLDIVKIRMLRSLSIFTTPVGRAALGRTGIEG